MAFEVYKPRGEKGTDKPALVTLSKNSIVLNKPARAKLNADAIELSYDNDTRTIRIKAKEDGTVLKKTKLFAKGFYNYFKINATGRYLAEFVSEENALFVHLDSALMQ